MYGTMTKSSLSPQQRCLVETIQKLNFGIIEGLNVQNGEPVFIPPPRIVRDIKFGGENGPRPELGTKDFILKRQAVDLFQELTRLREGRVECIEIRHGLPFRMTIEDRPLRRDQY